VEGQEFQVDAQHAANAVDSYLAHAWHAVFEEGIEHCDLARQALFNLLRRRLRILHRKRLGEELCCLHAYSGVGYLEGAP
jgi:hypothetical protein